MLAYGIQLLKQHGDHLTSVPWSCSSVFMQLHELSWLPSLRWEPGGRAVLAGHGLPADSAKHQYWGWPSLWSSCCVGAPCQGWLSTLMKAAWKLMLLVNDGPDWPNAFLHLSSTTLHVPLSEVGHIGAMMDGIHSINACGHLYQLQVWKVLQHGEHVVFPEGLNWGLEAFSFSFPGLPLWNTSTAGGPARD